MAFTATVNQTIVSGGATVASTNAYTGGSRLSIAETVADSETDYPIVAAVDVSEIQTVYIVSSEAVTLETNSGSSPDNTLSLAAGVPYIWHTGSYYTNLLTVDITMLYITNASGSSATFQMEVITDPTP